MFKPNNRQHTTHHKTCVDISHDDNMHSLHIMTYALRHKAIGDLVHDLRHITHDTLQCHVKGQGSVMIKHLIYAAGDVCGLPLRVLSYRLSQAIAATACHREADGNFQLSFSSPHSLETATIIYVSTLLQAVTTNIHMGILLYFLQLYFQNNTLNSDNSRDLLTRLLKSQGSF